jgi:hypothetical protein
MLQLHDLSADALVRHTLTADHKCSAEVPLLAGGSGLCNNPVRKDNVIWKISGCRYALVFYLHPKLKKWMYSIVDYTHEMATGTKHMAVSDMLVDPKLQQLVYDLFTSYDMEMYPGLHAGGLAFVNFNLGEWETDHKYTWRCHGHAQCGVNIDEKSLEKDVAALLKCFL